MRRVKSAPENLCNMKNNRKHKSNKSICLIFPSNKNNLELNKQSKTLEKNNIIWNNIIPFQNNNDKYLDNRNNLQFMIKLNVDNNIFNFEDKEKYKYPNNNNKLNKSKILVSNNNKKFGLNTALEYFKIQNKAISETKIEDNIKKDNNLINLISNTLMDCISDERVMPMEDYSVLNLIITYISKKVNDTDNMAELKLFLINTVSKYLASYIIHKYVITQLPIIIHSLPTYIGN